MDIFFIVDIIISTINKDEVSSKIIREEKIIFFVTINDVIVIVKVIIIIEGNFIIIG